MPAENTEKLAFFGLGAMGYPIAAQLSKAVGELIVKDIVWDNVERLCDQTPARPMAELGGVDTVFLCLPSQQAVLSVLADLPSGGPGYVIDFGAHSPDFVQQAAAICAARQITYCDAPVFGTPSMAARGELYFLFSGPRAVFDRFSVQAHRAGYRTRYAGRAGTASAVKVLQNALGTINLLAGAEALRICEMAGIDAAMFCDVVSECGGIGRSAVFEKFASDMVARRDSGEGRLRIAAKDMASALELASAHASGADLMVATARKFSDAEQAGMGDDQFSNIIKTV